jgi:transcription factor E
MLNRFLKEVMIEIAGKQGEQIVDLLDGKDYVNEFIIAKKLDITINQTRNILYKISDVGLVSSIRKKDKKKGWYTYFWKIEVLKSLEFLKGNMLKKAEQIKTQIRSRETKRFYHCERCNIEYTEENALVHNFTCDECGEVFQVKDNSKIIKDLKKELSKIEVAVHAIDEEIEEEHQKGEKKKARQRKKEEKETAKSKKIKAEARKAAAKVKKATSEKGKKGTLGSAKKKASTEKKKVTSKKSK